MPKPTTAKGFDCGEPPLNDVFRRYAVQQAGKGVASSFVVVDDSQPLKILGFYSLSAAQLDVQQLGWATQNVPGCLANPCRVFEWAGWPAALTPMESAWARS